MTAPANGDAILDWQAIANVAGAVIAAIGTWVLNSLHIEIRETRDELALLVRELPETYARRDDLRELMSDLKASLIRIEGKLDGKADKIVR